MMQTQPTNTPAHDADSSETSARHRGHAVVIGGSMAGLLAARALSDHFARVTIVDRDRFPEQPDHRSGVPQAHHAHTLLPRGQRILGRFFPGFGADLLAAGATPSFRFPVFVTPAGKLPSPPPAPRPTGPPGVYASRVLLEWHVRRRLLDRSGIEILTGTEVTGLIGNEDRSGVTGVRVRTRGADEVAETGHVITADLVVDASGRQSAAPEWLVALGFPVTPEETVYSGIGYASRLYRKPTDWPDEWDAIVINGRPPSNPRAGLILPIENGLWHVSLGGFAGHHPPTDETGFLEFARELPDPSLYEAIRAAEPVSSIRGYRTPQNRLRRFDALTRWPAGFIALGDSVCAFNPIYGQGMTVAALGAETLEQALASNPDASGVYFARDFQRELGKVVADPWFIASGEDLRWGVASTGARQQFASPLIRRYVERVLRRARKDPVVSGAYLNVISMEASPRSLFAPRVARAVLSDLLAELTGRAIAPADEFASSPAAIERLRALTPPALGDSHADAA